MGDLARLIEAVEAGVISTDLIMAAIEEPRDQINTLAAFDGYLNAAHALHDALLPGWEWGRTDGNMWVKDPAKIWCDKVWGGPYKNAARSWLLAILRALEADGNITTEPTSPATD